MTQGSYSKLFLGISIMGQALGGDLEAAKIWPFILSGKYDTEIRCAIYYQTLGKEANTIDDLQDPKITSYLERFKNMIRDTIQGIFTEAAKKDREELLKDLKDRNRPHELGTVAEIASRYNLSKSEVRRRKADGTLEQFITDRLKVEA